MNKAKPSVTIISIFYNRGYCVDESVQSLVNQTYNDTRILLIDDGSTDNTFEKLKKFESETIFAYTQQNQGFVNTIIQYLENCHTDYIAIHGSGDFSMPERIEKQVDYMEGHREVGAVGTFSDYIDETGQVLFVKDKQEYRKKGTDWTELDNIYSHGEVMIRTETYKRVGGYRKWFVYAQDIDLWVRINEISDLAIIPEVLYRSVSRKDGVRNNTEKQLIQQVLSELARQTSAQRKETGKDLFDRFGFYAVLMRAPSKRLNKKFAHIGIKAISRQDVIGAEKCFILAKKEGRSLDYLIGKTLHILSKISPYIAAKLAHNLHILNSRLRK